MELALSRCVSCRGFLTQVFAVAVRGPPHQAPGHELVYSHAVLSWCRSCRAGQLEKLVHDCFEFFDHWDYYGWHVLPPEDMDELRLDLKACGWPLLPTCECDVHRSMRLASERLKVTPWVGAVLPDWAERSRVARNVYRMKLGHTGQGLPVPIAADGSR